MKTETFEMIIKCQREEIIKSLLALDLTDFFHTSLIWQASIAGFYLYQGPD